jgi:hypothetical protein
VHVYTSEALHVPSDRSFVLTRVGQAVKSPGDLAEPATDSILRCLRSHLNIGAKLLGDKEYSADRMVQSSAAGGPVYTLSHPKHVHLHVIASNIHREKY